MDPSKSMFETWPLMTFVLGAPASGKGTLCKRLSEEFGMYHLSVGDFLRQKRKEKGQELIESYLSRSELLPGDVLIPLLQEKIEHETQNGAAKFLIDGFPRSLEQLKEFREQASAPALVIFFNCPKDICQQRFLTRKYEDRAGDDKALFAFRYSEFERNNSEILDEFVSDRDCRMVEVDTSGTTEDSWEKLSTALSSEFGGNQERKTGPSGFDS